MNKISRSALALFLTASLAVSFAACAPANTDGDGDAAPSGSAEVSGTDTETPELPPNTFRLNRLPDIGKYSEKNEIYTRLSEKLIDTLDPRKDYGTLVPFVGSKKDYKIPGSNDDEDSFYFGEEMSYGKYGLCTLGGMIVLDAVYDGIYPVYDRYGETCGYYSAVRYYDVDAENYSQKAHTYLIKSDGSAVYDIGEYSLMNVSDDGYTVYEGDIMSGNHVTAMYFGFDGKLRASTPNTADDSDSFSSYGNIGEFAKNGLANVTYSEYNGDDNFDTAYYIDKDGNTVIEGFRDAMPFSDYGIAVGRYCVGEYGRGRHKVQKHRLRSHKLQGRVGSCSGIRLHRNKRKSLSRASQKGKRRLSCRHGGRIEDCGLDKSSCSVRGGQPLRRDLLRQGRRHSPLPEPPRRKLQV